MRGKAFVFIAASVCCAASGCATTSSGLYDAAQRNDLAQVRQIVAVGGSVNAPGAFGMSPLYIAAANGNLEICRVLLDNSADPNAMAMGMSPLLGAIWTKAARTTETVRLLVERGANVNLASNWGSKLTPLMYCASYGNAEIARILVDAGADVNARDVKGRTAVDYATEYKKDEVLAVLRKAGAAVPYSGNAAKDVVMAAISGDRDKVRQLVEEGADPNTKDKSGKSLLFYAVENKWPEVAGLLVKKGAKVDEKDKDGWTLMMNAAFENDTQLLQMLESAGVKKSYTGNMREDLLRAVLFGDREKVKALIAQGADVNGRYRYNSPLLSYPAYKNDRQMTELLLDAKADPNPVNDHGWNPLTIGIGRGGVALGRLMMSRGANVVIAGNNAIQPLAMAITTGDAGFVKEILAKGAQPSAAMVALAEGRDPNRKDVNFPEIAALIKPELLRRQMLRAQAAVEAAQSEADYQQAIAEYNLAKDIAPDMPEIYYNLGMVQEKSGLYSDAIASLRKYIELAPNAQDGEAVRDMIYKLEYKRDRGNR